MKLPLVTTLLLICGFIAAPAARAAMVLPREEVHQSPTPFGPASSENERNAVVSGGKPEASRSVVMEMAKKKKAKKKKATSRAS